MKPIGGLLSACASAAAAYVDLRREVASLLMRAIGESGATQEEIAAAVGVSRGTVRRWLRDNERDDDGQRQALTFAGALALPPVPRRLFAAQIAGSLGCVLADAPAGDADGLDNALADAVAEHAEAVAHVLRAKADRAITRAENERCRAEIRQAQERLATLERELAESSASGADVVAIGGRAGR